MILLDTHILVWLLIAPENLSPKAKKAILAARKSGPLALSAISLWEIAWLAVNKRIDIDVSVDSFVKKCASYVQVLPVTPEIAVRSVQFPTSYPNGREYGDSIPIHRQEGSRAAIGILCRFSRQILRPPISNFEIGNWTLTHANGKTRAGERSV